MLDAVLGEPPGDKRGTTGWRMPSRTVAHATGGVRYNRYNDRYNLYVNLQGAVELMVGSITRTIVSKLRQFDWLLKMNNR